MSYPVIDPAHWRLSFLLTLGHEDVHELACKAVGTLTAYRLVLGRCLLAMQELDGHKEHGCSSAIHYACTALGVSDQVARECRRVAKRLQRLPKLTLAAEQGKLGWSKLREIVRCAVPATESYWLKLARKCSYKEIEFLVGRTPVGTVPGEADSEGDSYRSELRCSASPQLFAMIDQARRLLSIEKNEAVTTAEVLETSLVTLISKRPFDEKVLEKARQAADKDVLAAEARRHPVVFQARELACEMGLLEKEKANKEEDGEKRPARDESSNQAHSYDRTAARPTSASEAVDQKCPARDTSEWVSEEVEGEFDALSRSSLELLDAISAIQAADPATPDENSLSQANSSTADDQPDRPTRASASSNQPADSCASNGPNSPARDEIPNQVGNYGNTSTRQALTSEAVDQKRPARDENPNQTHSHDRTAARPASASEAVDQKRPARDENPNQAHSYDRTAARPTSASEAVDQKCPARDEIPNGFREDSESLSQATGNGRAKEASWQNLRLRYNAAARTPTRAQREELLRRDGWCCSVPGCPNTVWLHLHHYTSTAKGERRFPRICAVCALAVTAIFTKAL